MNIGIICYPTYGGSGVVATELGIALADKGHQIHFITYAEPARISNILNPNLFYHEVNISNYPLFEYPPYELALTSAIVDVVKHQKLDLLHVHYAIPHASAAIMAKDILKTQGIDIPVITTLHGTDITLVGKDPSYEPVVTYSINRSDVVTSVSEDLRKDTFKHFSVNREIEVIPNFIDLERFKKQHKDHFRKAICPKGEKLLVHTSNFRQVKRVDQVIRIFSEVLKKTPAKLLLIGDGPERPAIESLCRELGTCNDVRFLGKISDVEEVLSVSDVFLMPSEKESFGLAGLEAMACEVPVVSSDVGGLPEMNKDGFSGFICPVGDIDMMVEKTLYILSSEENLTKFKKQALERAKEFDIKEILPIYEEIYERVLAK
jgi:N-acetyl-alpha-D-glucosaminyl L-malate synthase BshA